VTDTAVPVVSVITPAFNCGRYLARTAESVRSQIFSGFEHIIVEDGSTDDTLTVAQRAADIDPRTRVVRHPDRGNHGVSASRNLGLAETRAPFVAFLDADDEWLPDMLALQMGVFDEFPSTVVAFARARCVDRDGEPLMHPDWPHLEWVIGHAPSTGRIPHAFGSFISRAVGIPVVTAVARRNAVAKIGGFIETLRFQVEDAVLLAQLCRSGQVAFSDRIVARYRVYTESFTASLTSLTEAESIWELYWELARDRDSVEDELATAMLGCLDRFLVARGVPWTTRWDRVRSVAEHLLRHRIASARQIRVRVAAAFPRHAKQALAVALRRHTGIGPTPVKPRS
jgi:glycosyltransferase involved in cell wall biosynthesis